MLDDTIKSVVEDPNSYRSSFLRFRLQENQGKKYETSLEKEGKNTIYLG